METIYLIFIIVLFILAISDLVVGVSNDAVNFLNSAVGSKAAPFKIIMIVAALGVLFGSVFSGGMMEIARSGIFHPESFTFSDVMLIFLAVMITDVILLDAFNTFGFPTSTTVSLVFELLGGAVAIALMKINLSGEPYLMGEYINSGKALAIISGILVSVLIAFTFGTIIQFIARYIFSFNYHKRLKYVGGVYGGLAITAIVYFIMIKGAKDAAFMTDEAHQWIQENTLSILAVSFVGFSLLLYLLNYLFKINILKIIVLVGTFALAMAFAGNDLVNFIGVPLAGYESFLTFMKNPGADPDLFKMGMLNDAVKTPLIFLILSGVVMVVTLYTSRKARTVIKTEVNLGRQDDGEERFGSSALSRGIVRVVIGISEKIDHILPQRVKDSFAKQFKPVTVNKKEKDPPAFDLIRASVNLVVSSALIALGTSMKLPLSTTYVTFMVAMGTSLSDGAWDRESAVFRITGVFSVIGGWFFTALAAFSVSFLLALFFFKGGFIAVFIMIGLAAFTVYRSHILHKRREDKSEETQIKLKDLSEGNILEICKQNMADILNQTLVEYQAAVEGLAKADLAVLRKTKRNTEKLTQLGKEQKNSVTLVIKQLKEGASETGHFYVQSLDYAREIIHSLNFFITPATNHLANNHRPMGIAQIEELKQMSQQLGEFFKLITTGISSGDFSNQETIAARQQIIINMVDLFRKSEIKRIKVESTTTRNSLLYLNLVQETKNLLLFSFNLYKAQRDFLLAGNET